MKEGSRYTLLVFAMPGNNFVRVSPRLLLCSKLHRRRELRCSKIDHARGTILLFSQVQGPWPRIC